MGYMMHKCLIVTTYNKKTIIELKTKLLEKLVQLSKNINRTNFVNTLSGIFESPINGYYSFIITPDGSKEGWDDSNDFDKFLDETIEMIKKYEYEDKSNPFDYVLVSYGGDEPELNTKILDYNKKEE